MPNNYLLTGLPKCGKSTLLERIVAEIPQKNGFLTKEVLSGSKEKFNGSWITYGGRTGFVVVGNGNPICTLAHNDFITEFKVSKYYVDVQGFEWALKRPLFFQYAPEQALYLDEIGQMQLFSPTFKKLVRNYLDAPNLFLGTLSAVYHDNFTKAIRKRSDVTILEVTLANREEMFHELYEIAQRHTPN